MKTDVKDRWEVEVYPALHIGHLTKEIDKCVAEARFQFAQRFGYPPDDVAIAYSRKKDVFSIEAQGTGIASPVRRRHLERKP